VSNKNLISELIANSHRAQIIHQNGVLVFANTAAARIFGFDTIDAFVKFAKAANLFANSQPSTVKSRTRILNFRRIDGHQARSQITERHVEWNDMPSTYLELEALGEEQISLVSSNVVGSKGDNDTYFRDEIATAMDWSRTDGGTLEVVAHPFDFGGVCLKLCEDLTEYAADRAVALNIEVTPRAQKIFHGDALKMARAASCMVRHAIDRVLGGRVDIVLRADEKGDNIMIDVCDNGMSYKPTDANILFEAPRNWPKSGHSPAPDEGLDLPLARCIARFLGGEVGLKANHIGGGLVRMRLPFPQVVQEPNTLRRTGRIHRKLDVLVVEDNPTSQHVLRVILEALGHRATFASNGKECLDILQHVNFDVIFMDLHMPVKDGYSATEAIRARERSGVLLFDKAIPILAITADRRPEARNRALAAGVSGFLTKPVHIPQIMGALAPYIEAQSDPIAGQPHLRVASRGA
jgi:two-component system, sensor histidine kinase